jgi:FKBP-type peptidyl-prolyl cis-trans isomerase
MNKLSTLLIAMLLLTAACDKSQKETPNGFKYTVIRDGDGIIPKVGEVIVFDYLLKDSKDSVWADTRIPGLPAAVMIADTSKLKEENGMVQMFRQISKGDSVLVEMPISKFFKDIVGGPVPPGIDTALTLKYLLNVTEVTDKEKYIAQQQKALEKSQTEQFTKDVAAIDKHLTEKGITAEKTTSGLRYVVVQPGKGATALPGQNVKVNYSGYLLNGTYFDSSIKSIAQEKGIYDPRREPYAPFDLVVDRSNVIKGWHEALKLMNTGEKATFYIPSTLGYGPQRMSQQIGENAILVFDIEMVEIK